MELPGEPGGTITAGWMDGAIGTLVSPLFPERNQHVHRTRSPRSIPEASSIPTPVRGCPATSSPIRHESPGEVPELHSRFSMDLSVSTRWWFQCCQFTGALTCAPSDSRRDEIRVAASNGQGTGGLRSSDRWSFVPVGAVLASSTRRAGVLQDRFVSAEDMPMKYTDRQSRT